MATLLGERDFMARSVGFREEVFKPAFYFERKKEKKNNSGTFKLKLWDTFRNGPMRFQEKIPEVAFPACASSPH